MELENFSNLDSILKQVHKEKIKLNNDAKGRARDICGKMEDQVREKLKKSKSLLHTLENGITYRGSYFSGVKISKPNEFDIDIQLKLPFNADQIQVSLINDEPGYVKINIKDGYEQMMKTPTWAKKYRGLATYMNKDGFLMESKIRNELESIFTQHFGFGKFALELDDIDIAVVKIKKSGPAFTFEVKIDDLLIDIDFVFVLYFDETFWPPSPIREFPFTPRSQKNYWFAVPKPNNNPLSWRLSFPHQENYFLDGNFNMKEVYRLLKALRDEEKWTLASYHIGTLFLWESENETPNYWKKSIGTLLMHMLNLLQKGLRKRAILFFWDSRCNMIKDLKHETLENIANRIGVIKRQIQNKYDDPDALRSFVFSIYHINNTLEGNTLTGLNNKIVQHSSKKTTTKQDSSNKQEPTLESHYSKEKEPDFRCILS